MPSHETIVTPFAAEKYPDIFSQKDTSVLTIDLPKEAVLNALKEDYQAMRNMIYGNIPEFEEILEFLEKLQEEVHGLVVT